MCQTKPLEIWSGLQGLFLSSFLSIYPSNRSPFLESFLLTSKYYQTYIGKTLEVLVETGNFGLTSNYIKVKLDKECEVNTFVDVKITEVNGIEVYGQVVD